MSAFGRDTSSIAVTAPRLDLSRRERRVELKRLESEALASVSASEATIVKVLLRNPRRESNSTDHDRSIGSSRNWASTGSRISSSATAPSCPATRWWTDDDVVEVRPVISGGARDGGRRVTAVA